MQNTGSSLHMLRSLIYRGDPISTDHALGVEAICDALQPYVREVVPDPNQFLDAAFLHDIGKSVYLGYPMKGDFSQKKYDEHPENGGYCLVNHLGPSHPAFLAALMHHERYDGSGFPYGLSDNMVPDFVYLIAFADDVHARATYRPHRKTTPLAQVLDEFRASHGWAPPHIKELLLSAIDNQFFISTVELIISAHQKPA